MPEGHTLHRLAADLNQTFAGEMVSVTSPQGRFADSAALVDHQQWQGAQAYGKHLFCAFEPSLWIHIHLGLIGQVQIAPMAPPRGQVRLRLAGETQAADLRGPQRCVLITDDERQAVLATLGPDPLDPAADHELAWRRVHSSTRSVAALLMDQSVLAGVGNVYRAEVLFRQRINPATPGRQLRRASWQAIWADLVELMPDGVANNRIDTVRAEHSPEAMGRPARDDDHGGEVYVYHRAGQPCHVCRAEVRTVRIDGRNLFWCGRCQRRA